MDKQFPVKFSKAVFIHDYFTPYGPYMGIEDDHYDRHIHGVAVRE